MSRAFTDRMDEMVEARAAEMTVEEAEAVIEEGTGEGSEAVEEAPAEEAPAEETPAEEAPAEETEALLRKRLLQKKQKPLLKKRPRHPLQKRGTRMSILGLTTEVKRLGRSRPRGHAPVATFTIAGIAILVGGIYLDTLNGLMPLLGVFCLMIAVFFCELLEDPNRPIPQDSGILVSPADGHVMFVRRERANGRRPSRKEREEGNIEHDEHTGDWYPKPCKKPLSFETEQRFVAVKEAHQDSDVWRIAIFMSPLDVHVNRAPRVQKLLRWNIEPGKEKGMSVCSCLP